MTRDAHHSPEMNPTSLRSTLRLDPVDVRDHAPAGQAAGVTHFLQDLINDLPEQIAILDQQCIIVAANEAWKATVEEHGYAAARPGSNYRRFCAEAAANGYEPATHALAALDDITLGVKTSWQLTYNGGERWSGHDFQICFHRLIEDGSPFILVTRFDVTELNELRRVRQQLSDSVMNGQVLERRRVARELHDSTAQLLAGAGLLLARLRQHSPSPEALEVVEELQDVLTEAQREIRLVAYLAHPPAVEKMGLAGALAAFVEGFERRTGLESSFEILGRPFPLSTAAQVALYRTTQEALANVHRHAHATRVQVRLCYRHAAAHLLIQDDGIGISRDFLAGSGSAGVGLASMRSRLSEIGGRFSVLRLSPGTAIIAAVRAEANRGVSGRTANDSLVRV